MKLLSSLLRSFIKRGRMRVIDVDGGIHEFGSGEDGPTVTIRLHDKGLYKSLFLNPELAAGVPFYGRQADPADVPKIQAPLMLQFAELDERINAGWPAYEEALKANGKNYVAHMYPGANHGFHNDTTPRFDEAAAKLAEDRTIAFFKENLM